MWPLSLLLVPSTPMPTLIYSPRDIRQTLLHDSVLSYDVVRGAA